MYKKEYKKVIPLISAILASKNKKRQCYETMSKENIFFILKFTSHVISIATVFMPPLYEGAFRFAFAKTFFDNGRKVGEYIRYLWTYF